MRFSRYRNEGSAQLSFPFSLAGKPTNGSKETQANRGGNRKRPDNDDDVFSKPGWHIPWYEAEGAHHTKAVKG